jgi:hypothetical protein
MSDSSPVPEATPATPAPASGATAAQEAFGKYKARLAGGPVAMPMMPGWAMPPSMGALPVYPAGYPYAPPGPERPHPMGSLTGRLGMTIRLGIDLLNAALASGASALGGGMAPQEGGHGCGCGCGGGCGCGHDCCRVMACDCCRPGVHGCGCDRC